MTPELKAAIAAIQPLSPTERQQLLQILTHSTLSTNLHLQTLSNQFWQGSEIEQMLATQTPKTVHDMKDLAADFWPEEDSIEEFLTFLQQQRQEIT